MTKVKNEALIKRGFLSFIALVLAMYFIVALLPQPTSAAPVVGTYLVTDSLRLRAGPGTSYDIVNGTVIPKNSSVIVEEFTDDYSWGRTSYSGNTGWVSMAYLEKIDEDTTVVGKSGEEICAEITSAYAAMRKSFGQSYSGWCGQYVKDMLNRLKIGFYGSGSLNGNKWMTTLVDDAVTPYGYKQVKYWGENCLFDILSANGGIAYNIVISFNIQSGQYAKYGHVVFINAIIDDMVYYSESFSTSRGAEGVPQVYSLSNFMNYYSRYEIIGAIHMTQGTYLKPVSGTKIENIASGKSITIESSTDTSDYDGAKALMYTSLGFSSRQAFHFEKVGDSGIYTIRPEASSSRVLSAKNKSSPEESAVVLSTYTGSASQEWYFQLIDASSYKYVIRSRANPEYVLTADSTSDSAGVSIQKYASGNNRQIWKIPTSQNLLCTVESIRIEPAEITIATDASAKLSAVVFPSFAKNSQVVWSSDNTSVVTVQGGTVFGKAKGSAIIRAKLADGSLFAVCVVTVKDELTLLGDANKDNAITLLDFNVVSRYLNGDLSANAINIENADINRDGRIDSSDLEEYKKYFSGSTDCLLYKEHGKVN